MSKTIRKFTLLVTLISFSFVNQAQQTSFLKSTLVTPDSSYSAICSANNYLPINSQRTVTTGLIGQLKDKRMLFADKGLSKTGVSVYDDNNWSYLDVSNNLNSNTVFSFYSDRKGNTWIGTDSGINVYNGKVWKSYSSKTTQINNINLINEDKHGNIWAFSTGYLNNNFILDTIKQVLKHVDDPIDGYINSTTVDKDVNMWVAARNGVYKYDGTNWTKYTTKQGLYQDYVTFIKSLNDTVYCFSGSVGDSIKKFDGNKFVSVTPPNVKSSGYKCLVADSDHNLWLMDNAGIVFKYFEGSWSQINISSYAPMYWLTSMFADIDGNIWFTNQLSKIAKFSNETLTIIDNGLDKGIGYIDAVDPFVDKKNNIWVKPLYHVGASKFDGKKWTYFNNDTLNIWFNNWESSFAQDKNGNIYTGGYQFVKYDGNRWKSVPYGSVLTNYSNTDNLMFDKKDHLWFSCMGNKIVEFNGTTTNEFSEADGLLYGPQKIVQDKDSNIWVIYGNTNKINKYDGKNWTIVNLPITGSYVGCSDAIADSLGNMWFGTTNGLVKYNKSTGMKVYNTLNSKIASDYIMSLCTDNQNNIWIAYNAPTLTLFSKNTFTNFSLKEYNNFAPYQGIAVDDQKNIYLGSMGSGLLKLSFSLLIPEITKTDIACLGNDNGMITIFPKKDDTYTFSIDGITYKKDTIYNNLKSGNYSVISKKGKCYSTPKLITITQPAGKFDVLKTDATCYGINNGFIGISTEGLGNVDYAWSNGKDSCAIKNIGKGKYTVTIKYGSCQFDRSYDISEPTPLILTENHLNACGNKGKIDMSLEGGNAPYTIKWSNGDTVANLKNLSAGNYTVSIKDANHCTSKDSTIVVKALNPIPASSIIGIPKAFICSENLIVSSKSDFISFQWYKGDSLMVDKTKSILVTKSGTYKVTVVDQNNCFAIDSIKAVKRNTYAIPQICLVTVDEATDKNKIIWNKFSADSSVIINVLKETTQSSIYSNIGKVPVYKSGIFIDENSDPATMSNRYKLNLTDECSLESDLGTFHKTIHLTSNMGTSGEVNLIWSGYEGFNFNSYNIYRGTSKDNLSLLATVPNNLNSYTDLNPLSGDKLYYQLEVISPYDCNPNALKAGIISSKSNIINRTTTPVLKINFSEEIKVTPNPVEDVMNLTFFNPNHELFNIKLCDASGKILLLKNTTESTTVIDRGGLKSGLYFLIIDSKIATKRIKVILK